MNIKKHIISLTILAVLIIFFSACGGVSKMISTSSMLKKESSELTKMSVQDIDSLVSNDVDLRRIRYDPDGVIGQYIRVMGTVNLTGYDDFKLDLVGKDQDKSFSSFILDDLLFVITLSECTQINHGDTVEILGLVSSSRLIKVMRELYPDDNIPDLVTVIAKDVRVIEKEPDEMPEK